MGVTVSRNGPLPMAGRVRHGESMSATRDLIIYARRNGGVFTTREAMALGLSTSTLQRRVADGVFVRVNRGVLALPGTATRPDLAMRAALRTLNAVVSHQSAAHIHELEPILESSQPSVTVSHRSTHSFPGVTVHQSTDLLDEHTQYIDGMRVTTPVRTLVDLSKVLGRRRLARVVEQALVSRKVDIDDLADLVSSLSRRGKVGMKRMHRVLDDLTGQSVPETELERILVDLIVDAGLPEPIKQFSAPWLKPLNGRVDLAYPDYTIVIEADSRRWHGSFDAFETDRIRDNAAQIAGWIVLRITWRMIKDDPSTVIQTVKGALEMRGW